MPDARIKVTLDVRSETAFIQVCLPILSVEPMPE